MAKATVGRPKKWDKFYELKPEQQEAVDIAFDITRPDTNAIERRKKVDQGAAQLEPLEGIKQERSDAIRKAVAADYAGYNCAKQAEAGGITVNQLYDWKAKWPKAFDQAEKELLERAVERYKRNLLVVKTGLSESGPLALRVLTELADDTSVKPNHRIQAAQTILKMLDLDGSAGNASREVNETLAKAIKEGMESLVGGRIIEAEDAEVIEDGSD